MDSRSGILTFHPADGLDAHAAAADHLDVPELVFHQLHDGVIFGGGLHEFQKEAVSAVVDDPRLEGLGDLEQSGLVFRRRRFRL